MHFVYIVFACWCWWWRRHDFDLLEQAHFDFRFLGHLLLLQLTDDVLLLLAAIEQILHFIAECFVLLVVGDFIGLQYLLSVGLLR